MWYCILVIPTVGRLMKLNCSLGYTAKLSQKNNQKKGMTVEPQ
jgi:hypothetical protein